MQEYTSTYEVLKNHLEHNKSLSPSYRKGLEEGLEAGYRKAIDDFLHKILKKYTTEEDNRNYMHCCAAIKQELADIATELKMHND